jgi:hypothetical protein
VGHRTTVPKTVIHSLLEFVLALAVRTSIRYCLRLRLRLVTGGYECGLRVWELVGRGQGMTLVMTPPLSGCSHREPWHKQMAEDESVCRWREGVCI